MLVDMAVVLTDGGAAAVKAADVAMQPHLFLKSFDDEQLIFLHCLSKEAAGDIAHVQTIIGSVIEHVEKSKHAKDVLNYKVELVREESLLQPDRASSPNPDSKPSTATPAPRDGLKITSPSPTEEPRNLVTGESNELHLQEAFAHYVASRAVHFGLSTVVLGCGNVNNGKQIVIGRFTRAVYSLGSAFNLWFIKHSGANFRPGNPVRYLALVDGSHRCRNPQVALRYALRTASVAKRDRVSFVVVANNGAGSMKSDAEAKKRLDELMEDCRDTQKRSGMVDDSSPNDNANGGGTPETTLPEAPSSSELPLEHVLHLEPTAQFPQPTVHDVPQQLIRFIANLKVDVLVIPPQSQSLLSHTVTQLLLSLPKPHVAIPSSAHRY
jgi:hypothetical protein